MSRPSSRAAPRSKETDEPIQFGRDSALLLPLVVGSAALAAGLSGQSPTGTDWFDVGLTAALAAAVTALGSRASARGLVLSAGLAVFFSAFTTIATLIGLASLATALAITTYVRLDRRGWTIAAAVVAGIAVNSVLHLPSPRFFGSASLLAAIALGPVVFTGFRRLPPLISKRVTRVFLALVLLCATASLLTLLAAVSVRSTIEAAIDDARAGLDAIQDANQALAVELFGKSEQQFDRAATRLSGPLSWGGRAVPLVAQHVRALETASRQGSRLVTTAAETSASAEVDQLRGSNGAIDLALVHQVNTDLAQARTALADAMGSVSEADSRWLIPALRNQMAAVAEELGSASHSLDLAWHATSVLPGMLGDDGPRRYLILFLQSAESREFGGFVGAYGVLEAQDGSLTLLEAGSINDDIWEGARPGTIQVSDASLFPPAYLRFDPANAPQNLTSIQSFTMIADAARDLVPKWKDDPDYELDGVLALDPYALAGMLELTGPIHIAGWSEPIGADNVVDFLLRDQYLEFSQGERDDRQDALQQLSRVAFEKLLAIELPGPERLGSIFGPLARADRLAFHAFDENENRFIERIFLGAELPVVGSAVEMFGIYSTTLVPSKLDAYTYRDVEYTAWVDPETGIVDGQLNLVIFNDTPEDAPGYVTGAVDPIDGIELGTNVIEVGVYTRSEILEVTSPDASIEVGPVASLLGYQRHSVTLEIPAQSVRHISLSTRFEVLPERYDLFVPSQAAAVPGEVKISVRPATGWSVIGDLADDDGTFSTQLIADIPSAFTLYFARE